MSPEPAVGEILCTSYKELTVRVCSFFVCFAAMAAISACSSVALPLADGSTDQDPATDGGSREASTLADASDTATDGSPDASVQSEDASTHVDAAQDGGAADAAFDATPPLSLIRVATGRVRCWGAQGYHGHPGVAAIGDNESPASVGDVNVGGSATHVATGASHTCAVLSTGAVRCWGNGSSGQLGYASTASIGDNQTPASAGDVNVGGPVIQIAAGGKHTCAVLTTGAVRCWGSNLHGQLGYVGKGTIGDNETPASAGDVNVGGAVKQIAAGRWHTCALLTTGAVRCWGMGTGGRLGYGSTASVGASQTPASVGDVNVGGVATQIATGENHSCALLSTGAVRCWGDGSDGALGYGNMNSIGDNEVPATAGDVNVGGPVVQIVAGGLPASAGRTCALLSAGGVRCWGASSSGELGYANTDTIGDDETPAAAGDIALGGEAIVAIATGWSHSCAVRTTGGIVCWGAGSSGVLGYGKTMDIGDDESPASAGVVQVW
jgi:alpha-tubulin suppressor-like RCC1 family protein